VATAITITYSDRLLATVSGHPTILPRKKDLNCSFIFLLFVKVIKKKNLVPDSEIVFLPQMYVYHRWKGRRGGQIQRRDDYSA
jgi:hypothetical protein